MRYRYLKDPLFLFCVVLYFLNRWVIKPYFPNEFCRCFLNDVICIPFWVPIMLFIMRKTGLRREDGPPGAAEILVPLIVWSWIFEVLLPRMEFFKHLATSDHRDILGYTVGACFATWFWTLWYRPKSRGEIGGGCVRRFDPPDPGAGRVFEGSKLFRISSK